MVVRLTRPLGVCVLCLMAWAVSAGPAVPGFERLAEAKADSAAQGELLLSELNCVSCHSATGTRIIARPAPDLSRAGARLTPQYIRAYLDNPQAIKPGAVMPDLFHLSEEKSKEGAIDFLVHYLVSLGGPIAQPKQEGTDTMLEQGRHLYHTIGCVACHAPEKPIKEKIPSIPHGKLAMATTVEQMTLFLLDPSKARPGGRMPNFNLQPQEARALAVYLLRDQFDNPQTKSAAPVATPGLKYSYYERDVPNSKIQTLEAMKPTTEGTIAKVGLDIPGRRAEQFALRFTGKLQIPREGKYRLFTASDDGSRLYIDGNLIVDNDRDQGRTEMAGEIQLSAGAHEIDVTYYERGGPAELQVYWEGPGLKKQEIPAEAFSILAGRPMIPLQTESFIVDPQKAMMGQQMFGIVGCAACHTIPGVQSQTKAPPLANLDISNPAGCMSPAVRRGAPKYNFSDQQWAALHDVLAKRNELAMALAPKAQVLRTMASMNCFACHQRDKVGGPTSDRQDFFKMTAEFDMGDEGRIPPLLTGVGHKLMPAAMEKIIFSAEMRIRPVLATRMPQFARQVLPDLVDNLIAADLRADAPRPPKFSEKAAHEGRILVGSKNGYGCVNCHSSNGVKSLGMPGPDLTTVHDRIQYGWFHELMLNPAEKNPATRMPQLWFDEGPIAIKGYGGDTNDGQIAAIWDYLSLGRSMALPPGLEPSNGLELTPTDAPIVFRAYMHNVSPRTICVGYPEQVHIAFDANAVRLARTWRGKYLDVRPSWESRGGGQLNPISTDVVDLAAGPAIAVLESAATPWPVVQAKERNVGGKFLGYTLDEKGMPTFSYLLSGVTIRETASPRLRPGGADLVRRFQLQATEPRPAGLSFLAGAGKSIEPRGEDAWLIDGRVKVRLAGIKATVRESAGARQLIGSIPVSATREASFSAELSW